MKKSFYNKLFLCGVMLVLVILSHITAQAQIGGVPVWTNRFNGPGNSDDTATAMAVDGSGNVFVTGNSYGGGSSDDYATIKYSGAGVALWTNRYNGPGNSSDGAKAVAVDTNGNVFVTGFSTGSGSLYDYATIKYSGAGVALWTNRYNGPGNSYDSASAVAVDGSSNVFVTGYSIGSGSFQDYATIKYSGEGLALWTNRYNGPANNYDQAIALAVDGSGNVFVTGQSSDVISIDYATIAYSGAGVALWTNRYNGPANNTDQAKALAVDGNGNVFVTGTSSAGGSDYDYVTIAYSGAGVALWTNRYNGPANGYDQANAIAVDTNGNVFVTGYSPGSGSSIDYATIKYSGAGVALWTNRYNGAGNASDIANAVAVDANGNVLVTGYTYSGGSSSDYATIKYFSSILPSLTVARTATNKVVVSWPSLSTGFTLQSTTNLVSPVIWNTNLPSPVVINGKNTVTNLISGTRQFFRLSQ